tara:strand:+ start:428 stop:1063 length:636 start_codon:yes stop_codon:yes gene_type:complete
MKTEYEEKLWFPVRVWEFHSTKSLLKSVNELAEAEEYQAWNLDGGVGTSFPHLEQRPEWTEMKMWLEQCSNKLLKDNGYLADRMEVTGMWCNRSNAKTGHHHTPHRHVMSYWSSIYYITGGTPTTFIDPLAQREWAQLHLDGGPYSETRYNYRPEAGTLLIFPAYLMHGSQPNDRMADRLTLAANFFPFGDINIGAFDMPMMNIEKNEVHK